MAVESSTGSGSAPAACSGLRRPQLFRLRHLPPCLVAAILHPNVAPRPDQRLRALWLVVHAGAAEGRAAAVQVHTRQKRYRCFGYATQGNFMNAPRIRRIRNFQWALGGVSDPHVLLPETSGNLVTRAILESTHIMDSKMVLDTTVSIRAVLAAGCM